MPDIERDLAVADAWLSRACIADAGPPPAEAFRAVAHAKGLREAITEALHWHVYSVERDDPDGNGIRMNKVRDILQGAIDG